MRTPINPISGWRPYRFASSAVSFTVDIWQAQPQDGNTAAYNTVKPTGGRLTDDAAQPVRRSMQFELATKPGWLAAGMWIRATVGVQIVQPVLYRMPVLCITDIAENLSGRGGVNVIAEDPSTVIDGRPYETDTALTGTLRQLVSDAYTTSLSRTPDMSAVPAVALPTGLIAEFGQSRWTVCLNTADTLGYALGINDIGDPVAVDRTTAVPTAQCSIERSLTVQGGAKHYARTPTTAKVLLSRGTDIAGLIGTATAQAITGITPPAWYRPMVVTDRAEGGPLSTQADADKLAYQLIRSQLFDADSYDGLAILPSPWLEAGVDAVTFYGVTYMVRSVDVEFPSLATTVTLRRAV